jgi:hypothetical protein
MGRNRGRWGTVYQENRKHRKTRKVPDIGEQPEKEPGEGGTGVFHAMENFFDFFPCYGRFSSTVWKTVFPLAPGS